MNLAETIYRKSLALSPQKAQEVLDFIDFLIARPPSNSQPPIETITPSASLLSFFEAANLVGCLETDEQLSTTYKEKLSFAQKHLSP